MGWLEDAKGNYGGGRYEYGWGGDGTDTDRDGKGEFDCSHLVYNILKDAGYDVEYRNSTSMTNSGFYDVISDDIKPGDIIYFPPQGNRPGHIGIVETYDPTTKSGTFFGSQSSTGPATTTFGPNAPYWNTTPSFLRPKNNNNNNGGGSGDGSGSGGSGGSGGGSDSSNGSSDSGSCGDVTNTDGSYNGSCGSFNGGKNVPVPTPTSPIILDLDGDGVETTNVKAGAYFDHDINGFSEQTGWAAPDDGMLVRDIDGNGSVDDGKELFGNETLLSDGTKASNGFQALSELDSNADGKIDGNDAAWGQLLAMSL